MVEVRNNYITEEEEKELLSHFPKHATSPTTQRNSVKRYGSLLPYKSRVTPKIPDYFLPLVARLNEDNIISSDSITVNEYHPNQSIDWHIDSLSSGPSIVVLSLLSEATMLLRKNKETKSIILAPRSLLIMTEEERYQWEHAIQPLVAHRYSIVFRKGTPLIKKSQ